MEHHSLLEMGLITGSDLSYIDGKRLIIVQAAIGKWRKIAQQIDARINKQKSS